MLAVEVDPRCFAISNPMSFRNYELPSLPRVAVLLSLLCLLPEFTAAQSCIVVSQNPVTFPKTAVGISTQVKRIGLTNKCGKTITITGISISAPEFLLDYGWPSVTKLPSQTEWFAIRFRPDSASTFNGTFTATGTGFSPVTVNLSGTGSTTLAAASFSTTALPFGNQVIGSTSVTQTLNLTNTGTASFNVESVYADPPFAVTGFSGQKTSLKPGNSLPLQVTFSPWQAGSYNGTLVMTSDVLPAKGVTLSGTGISAPSLAVTNFPTLQVATQGAAFSTQLNTTSGTAPMTWSLGTGSTLPTGLSLSSQGMISGTLDPSVALGNYTFTVSVTDSSSPPQTATSVLTLPVMQPNGDECNNIEFDMAGTSTPLTDLVTLGTGTYLGTQGGLYQNGSSVMPDSHDADGVSFATAIQPLNSSGQPDPNGKYVLLLVGMSCARASALQFIQDAYADPSINPNLVIVSAAMPRASAYLWSGSTFGGWTDITDFFLPQNGVTANQVVAAWVLTTDGDIPGVFPGDMVQLQAEFESIAQNLHSLFPNLTMAFYTSRFYAGYGNGQAGTVSPEPYAYESAFAVRGMIQDQLNGLASMNYNPANGTVKAPWVAWGDYDWANGLNARPDGFAWNCQDFMLNNGEHNSPPGSEKDANLMLNFFRTNDATVPWFLAPGSKPGRSLARRAGWPF